MIEKTLTRKPLAISTLSPIHIGCDEDYEPSSFVMDNGLLHVFEPADLLAALKPDELKELGRCAGGADPIGALQQFFRARTEPLAGLARHWVYVVDAIADEYAQKAGRNVQKNAPGASKSSGKETERNRFQIARTAFNPIDYAPYLPGSALKGSIRTAWLNHLNKRENITNEPDSRRLQQRLLHYEKIQDDPFRCVHLVDCHSEAGNPPPTRVLYAVSKRKRPLREGESSSGGKGDGVSTYFETVPECLPAAFIGELRLSFVRQPSGRGIGSEISWQDLCTACNDFYLPKLRAELNHEVLAAQMDGHWKRLMRELLDGQLGELIAAHQGFLARVGRHSGAESVTLDGVRRIKILGPRVDGKTSSNFRSETTQKRLASRTKEGNDLLPFSWIWVDACDDDQYRHHSDSVRARLAEYSEELRAAHRDRLARNEERERQRQRAREEEAQQRRLAADHAQAQRQAETERAAWLATLTPNLRRVEEFKAAFAARAEQLRGGHERLNGDYHGRARKLAEEARTGADWSAEEKRAAAEAIAECLPKVVEKIDKGQLKKLGLNELRGL